MTCVDVGANYGYLTLVMAQQVSPGGTVLSFEPNPNICPVLVRNIGDNGYRSVGRAFECAIAAVDGHMLPFQFPRCDQPIDVLTRTVDSIVAEHDLSALDLIKIDIDGPELEALRGAAESIRKYRPVIVTEVNRQKDEILHFLTDLGYRCFDIRGNEIERAESLELPCNVLACTLPQYQIIYDRLP
ncbi:MAG: FkbM family methyltransferase [Anaerolineae bacterium]|nr:FkbM family methyltransferase [Anaerolineae bacterium]